ncbi:MAG: toll/interleukin-1 receptor domain-containing protein [Hyphomonadaceae bacterium]
MGQVFLSYATEDAAIARQVADGLRAAGVSVWIAPDSILPGQAYNEAIVAGLKASDTLAVLVSRASNASKHVMREVGLADTHGKRIVPVRIEAVEPSDGLTYYLSLPQWVEWHAHGAAALAPMIGMLGGAISPPAAVAAVPLVAHPAVAIPGVDTAIEIRRTSHLTGAARNVAILINGGKGGEVGNGKSLTLPVQPGRHEVVARVDYIKSAPFAVDVRAGRTTIVELSLPNVADVGAQLSGLLGQSKYFQWKLVE